jgi:hypothetical protein
VIEKRNLPQDTLQSIISNYKDALQRLGKSRNTITILKELEQIQKDLLILDNCKFVLSEEGVKSFIVKKMILKH